MDILSRTLDLDAVETLLIERGWSKTPHPIFDELCLAKAVAIVLGIEDEDDEDDEDDDVSPGWATDEIGRVSVDLFAPVAREFWPDRVEDAEDEDVAWAFNDHERTGFGDIRTLLVEARYRRKRALAA